MSWVSKLTQKSFQTRKQQFVQRCETMVGADACKGSYFSGHRKKLPIKLKSEVFKNLNRLSCHNSCGSFRKLEVLQSHCE